MAIGGAGLLAGAGALWFFLQSLGKKGAGGPAAPCATGYIYDPRTGACTRVDGQPAGGSGVDNTGRDAGIATQVAGGFLSVGAKVIQSVVTAGATGSAAAGTGTASGGAAAAEVTALATTGAGWGGVVLLAAIIAVIVATQIFNSVQIFQNALFNFFNTDTTVRARTWFKWFVGAALTAGKPPSLGYVPAFGPYRLALPSDVIRKAVLTSLYLDYLGQQATYTALEGFWSRSTGQVPGAGTPVPIGGSVQSGQPWSVVRQPTGFTTEHIKYVLGGPGSFQCVSDANPPCNYASIVAPASFSEAYSAALSLLGDKWQAATSLQEFNGKLQAIAFASGQLFKEFMPSPYDFVTAVRDTVVPGWQVQEATYWTTAKQPLTAYWLVDPATGNRVAPAKIRETMTMVVSMKGMEVSPGTFAGGRFAGRRFARFGDTTTPGECCGDKAGNIVACSDSRAAVIVACPTIESQAALDRQRTALKVARHGYTPESMPSVGGGGVGGLLPWAAGAFALAKVMKLL
jgi:hypothetical protein